MASEDVNKLNKAVAGWGINRAREMKEQMARLGVVDTGRLFQRLKSKINLDAGEVDRISFKFPRYGIFVEKGVGRGQGISNQANGLRKAKPWFSNSLSDKAIDELATIVSEINADRVITASKSLANGK